MNQEIGAQVNVRVQVSAGGFVKRASNGKIDFVAPLPCPFNYGELPGTLGGDGDPVDAVVLGPRIPRGELVAAQVQGAVAFVDAGAPDLKLVCSASSLSALQRAMVLNWFRGYGLAKRTLNLARGKRGETRCTGWISADEALALVAAAQPNRSAT